MMVMQPNKNINSLLHVLSCGYHHAWTFSHCRQSCEPDLRLQGPVVGIVEILLAVPAKKEKRKKRNPSCRAVGV